MYNYNHFQKSFKKERKIWEQISYYFRKIPFIWNLNFTKEIQLASLFGALFIIIILRLFYLQVIQHDNYDAELLKQSTSLASINAERWDIYALDKTWQPTKLTENINLYDIAVDPREIWYNSGWVLMKVRFIELISPIVYKHLCIIHWMDNIQWNKEECIKNIESFANIELLPKMPEFFYYGSEYDSEWNKVPIISTEYSTFDFNAYNTRKQKVIDDFSKEQAMEIITNKLDEKIKKWIKEKNYVWYYTDEKFLQDLKDQNFNFISIEWDYYVYVIPRNANTSRDKIYKKNI